MNPDDVLTEWERLAQDATEGPWEWGRNRDNETPKDFVNGALVGGEYAYGCFVDDGQPGGIVTLPAVSGDGPNARNNAIFVAAARTAWPAATAALRAVLDLHRPDPANGTTWCRRCGEAWPCATAQVVIDALGGQV